jgi:addiction module RelE/StbE family toxin
VKIVWSFSALEDIELHYSYIARFNPKAAAEVAADLYGIGQSLKRLPMRGRPGIIEGTREIVSAPYVIVYQVDGDMVHVLRVWHEAQYRE